MTTEPGTTRPNAARPGSTDPGSTSPDSTGPRSTDPDSTDPGDTGPRSTAPATARPAAEPAASPAEPGGPMTYAAAGVDIEAGEAAVELMKATVRRTRRSEVVGDLGGFAGLFGLDLGRYRRPLLASSTDGVGTKLVIAHRLDVHDTIGIDLVAMVVDDLVVCGAEPLFLQDYIACGRVRPERIAAIVAGIAEGCLRAGCALLGGETAEHGDLMGEDEYDVSGTGVGIVEADAVLGEERVRAGDVLIGLGSSGLHSNGFALARQVLLGRGRLPLDAVIDELAPDQTLGQQLLTPTRIYARDCLALIEETDVHAFAHITGGGIPGNLVRVVPPKLEAVVDRSSWAPQPIFELIARRGRVTEPEMERTFNMGVGMVAVVPPEDVDRARAVLLRRKVPAWVMGEVRPGAGAVQMTGAYG
jgi:phosphoribosylformylglycinamidine cyclo-ligase